MDTVISVTQIIYYVAMSIAGPLAVIAYLKSINDERLEKEYKTYDELDNRLFEYQKLALEYYDLDILDVPNNDPSLAFDKKRKQEMVAVAILFSLFERAFLMFSNQADKFRQSQWSGWKHFLNGFLRRESVRTAWELSKESYDTDFQIFMDRKIADFAPQPVEKPAPALARPTAAETTAPVASVCTAPSVLVNGQPHSPPSGLAARAE